MQRVGVAGGGARGVERGAQAHTGNAAVHFGRHRSDFLRLGRHRWLGRQCSRLVRVTRDCIIHLLSLRTGRDRYTFRARTWARIFQRQGRTSTGVNFRRFVSRAYFSFILKAHIFIVTVFCALMQTKSRLGCRRRQLGLETQCAFNRRREGRKARRNALRNGRRLKGFFCLWFVSIFSFIRSRRTVRTTACSLGLLQQRRFGLTTQLVRSRRSGFFVGLTFFVFGVGKPQAEAFLHRGGNSRQ
mmetsp:Transcript_28298/g.48515  ORF Transcript_28298/g.48515 Transcript_28298/m.48515 type:complete len:243 (+) Transcript_28298:971-1699(+)